LQVAAFADAAQTQGAGERCAHRTILDRGLQADHAGLGRRQQRLGIVEIALAGHLALEQLLQLVVAHLAFVAHRAGLGEEPLLLLGVHLDQQIAGRDLLAVVEVDLGDVIGAVGRQRHRLVRQHRAQCLEVVGERRASDVRDDHRRHRRRLGARGFGAAVTQQLRQGESDGRTQSAQRQQVDQDGAHAGTPSVVATRGFRSSTSSASARPRRGATAESGDRRPAAPASGSPG